MCFVFASKLCIVISVMFQNMVSEFISLCPNVQDLHSPRFVSLTSAVSNVVAGMGGMLRYSYTGPEGKVSNEELNTAYVGWQGGRRNMGSPRDAGGQTHAVFMNMTFTGLSEKWGYETRLRKLIDHLRGEPSVLTEPSLSVMCASDIPSDEVIAPTTILLGRTSMFLLVIVVIPARLAASSSGATMSKRFVYSSSTMVSVSWSSYIAWLTTIPVVSYKLGLCWCLCVSVANTKLSSITPALF